MYEALKIVHSLLRYALVFAAIYAIYRAVSGLQNKTPYTSADNKASVFLIAFVHTQLVLGLLLYFVFSPWTSLPMNMKDSVIRFWKVEHIAVMVIAVVLFQLGRTFSKKATEDIQKHKKAAIFYGIAFVLMMASIPWPFMKVARPWLPF
jgi:uncharacterized membrane protein